MVDEGIITFVGNNQSAITSTTGNAQVTFTLGGGSRFASIEAAPHANFVNAIGKLVVEWAGETREFRDCVIDGRRIPSGGNGTIFVYEIRNRLWRWEEGGGWVSGYFNLRNPDGTIVEGSEKSVRELVEILLDQLNEPGVDLSAIPDLESPPEIRWDHSEPYAELTSLLADVGCRVALCPDDEVRIFRVGVGGALPSEGRINPEDIGLSRVARADGIQLFGEKVVFEATFATKPVGLDTDGTLKDLKRGDEADLSYKDGPWEWLVPGVWFDEAADEDEPKEERERRELARESVYKWFQITTFADGTLKIPGTPITLEDIRQVELRSVKIEQVRKSATGEVEFKPATVEGEYLKDAGNTPAGTPVKDVGFSVDAKQGLVKFSEPMLFQGDETTDPSGNQSQPLYPAVLYLRTSFTVSDVNRAPVRYGIARNFPSPTGAGMAVIRHAELRAHWNVPYELQITQSPNGVAAANAYKAGKPTGNISEVDERSQQIFDAHLPDYELLESRAAEFNGFQLIQIDGNIRQVAWSLQGGLATTRAALNSEREIVVPRFDVVRRQATAKREEVNLKQTIERHYDVLSLDNVKGLA